MIYVKKEIAQHRYDICKSCEHFNIETKNCDLCGCFMKVKVKIHEAFCPLNKWFKKLNVVLETNNQIL